MSDIVAQKVRAIIAEQALVDQAEVTDATTLEDLGVDSLGLVESIFAIEEAFDVSVPFNANAPQESEFDISNVGAIIDAVRGLVQAKA
jgi:acyl carrier protein